ncbi:PREDICTED: uncharacterized protein LOC109238766 isoform X2 [Nicotiana attenuata]|uniref:uncharacterized protein LOC109238766 isoform X2 n=1 Tax=Nicotiana attenuata TaxID=49451 RepID=UPI0009048400|nr:PREDICTED: uncharacterized protein LOC109238766 isoform X2 [Nicotiana attenuata]
MMPHKDKKHGYQSLSLDILSNLPGEFFATGEVPIRLPFYLNTVKSLKLSAIVFDELDEVSCTLCLIRSFPYLENLKIQVFAYKENIPAVECLLVEGFSSVTFSCLREVKLKGDPATKPGMQFIKLLLAKSTALVRMLIKCRIEDDGDGDGGDDEVLHKTNPMITFINEFPRASPKAEIIVDITYC